MGEDETAQGLVSRPARLQRLSRRLLPRTWVLRADLRRINRLYPRLITEAKGEDREKLDNKWWFEGGSVEEELKGLQTGRLLRRARKHYIVTPSITPHAHAHGEDDNWTRGLNTHTWYLKPAAVSSLWRQIEDARKRRRDVWEAWAKIIGGIVTALVALGSVIVSLVLAWRR